MPVARPLLFASIAARDLLGLRRSVGPGEQHLLAAVAWLKRAHDMSPDDGVSYGFSLRGGWRGSYPETSGYIVPTLFEIANRCRDDDCRRRAIRIADWLQRVQLEDGSIPNPALHEERGIVFDTGQVIFGLLRAHRETGDEEYLRAARRAGRWLTDVAASDGLWKSNTHNGVPHVYNTRVAWALLELNVLAPRPELARTARANLDWALQHERRAGFSNCAFHAGVPPYTHTIAYATRGLLESAALLNDPRYLEAALRTGRAIARHVREDGFVPSRIDPDGRRRSESCCLTGNAQFAIVWTKLAEATGNVELRQAAERALAYVTRTQNIATRNLDIRGAIKGSHPIWGRYSCLTYPNWATKFFIDALLLHLPTPPP